MNSFSSWLTSTEPGTGTGTQLRTAGKAGKPDLYLHHIDSHRHFCPAQKKGELIS